MARPGKTGGKPPAPAPSPAAAPTGTPPAPPAGTGKGKKFAVAGIVKATPVGKGKAATKPLARCEKKTCGKVALKGKKHCTEHLSLRERIPALPWRWILPALLLLLLALLLSRCDGIPPWLTPPAKPTPTSATPPPQVTPGGKKGGFVPTPVPQPACPTTLRVAAFHDSNGNGVRDNGEAPLSGFQYKIAETGTVGTTNSGGADAMEATPDRKYTVVITGQPGSWAVYVPSMIVSVPSCQDKTVYFGAKVVVASTPAPTPSPTAKPTAQPSPTPAPQPTPVQTASPVPSPTPVKTPSPTQDYGCNCTVPSTFVPTPSPRPSGVPSPTPIFR